MILNMKMNVDTFSIALGLILLCSVVTLGFILMVMVYGINVIILNQTIFFGTLWVGVISGLYMVLLSFRDTVKDDGKNTKYKNEKRK